MQCTIFAVDHRLLLSPPQDEEVDSLGGYRLIRRLGIGSRSDVWLGSDGSETAAIKVFHAGAPRERIDGEIDALGRVSGRHVLRLEDLAMGPDGAPCLILQRLSQWNLGRLLADARPSGGEAVTVLAPLCLAVAELHRCGVTHGRIRGSSVLFDDVGAPVLASFGDAGVFGEVPDEARGSSISPAQLSQQSAVAADLDSLAAMCLSTLDPESGPAQWLNSSPTRDNAWFASELAERLFSYTRAAPVRFPLSPHGGSPTSIPSRLTPRAKLLRGQAAAESLPREEAMGTDSPPHPFASSIATFLHLPDGMVNTLFESSHRALERGPISSLIQRTKTMLGPVRKPVWILAALVATGVVLAAALLPTNGSASDEGAAQSSPSPSPTVATQTIDAAILGEEPLAAAAALLDARDDCFAARSVLCFDSVNQQGSAAMDSDSTQVRLLQDGGVTDSSLVTAQSSLGGSSTPRQLVVVERLGDSVLLTISIDATTEKAHDNEHDGSETTGSVATQPDANATNAASFSLLIIKGDAGWRIRDLVPLTNSPY